MKLLYNTQLINLELSPSDHRLYGILDGRKQRLDHGHLKHGLERLVRNLKKVNTTLKFIC